MRARSAASFGQRLTSATSWNSSQRDTPISTPSASVGLSPTRNGVVAYHGLELVVPLDDRLTAASAQRLLELRLRLRHFQRHP